jgi:flagellin-like protein
MPKGITPVVAIILLLMITISIVGGAMIFFGQITKTMEAGAERKIETATRALITDFRIDNVYGNRISIRNTGVEPFNTSLLGIYLNGRRIIPTSEIVIQPGEVRTLTFEGMLITGNLRITGGMKEINIKTYYPAASVLSIYPCECLLDDIANNFPELPITVDCVKYDAFSVSYDISDYNVIFLDGADCWGGKYPQIDANEQKILKDFVTKGGGLILTHDTLGISSTAFIELEDVLGIVYDSATGCCPGSDQQNKSQDSIVTNSPFILPNPLSTQWTHVTRQRVTDATVVYRLDVDPDVGDEQRFYLTTHKYGSGKAAFIQWGHSAYKCDCTLWDGIPGQDEQKAIINTIFWVIG